MARNLATSTPLASIHIPKPMLRTVIVATLTAALATGIAVAQEAPAKIILLVGPPGSGKSTQAQVLAKKYSIPAFSMSDILKKEMASRKKDNISKALSAAIASGDMLPDDVATDMIRLRLTKTDLRKGFILDGYPATAGQAKSLDAMLQEHQLPKVVAVVLDAPDDVIRKRMLGRGRADDKPEIIERRIKEFRNEAAMLAGWVGMTQLVRVNAAASMSDVSSQIIAGLENAWSKPK